MEDNCHKEEHLPTNETKKDLLMGCKGRGLEHVKNQIKFHREGRQYGGTALAAKKKRKKVGVRFRGQWVVEKRTDLSLEVVQRSVP